MYNFEFKKSLGQNFLKDENIVNKIVDEANIDKDTLVIEIGPGSGVLSKKILSSAGFAILYEIDSRLEKILQKNLEKYKNYKLIIKDFLEADVLSDISPYKYKKIFIVANLPYYITTPIITKIIEDKLPIDKLVIMIQKEVASRFVATPNSKDYGSITVLLNYYYSIKKLFDVSKNSFIPKPKVDSSVIMLEKKELVPLDVDFFKTFVRDSFKYKRKNLKNNLSNYDLNRINKILKKYNLDITFRAENLSLEIFIELVNELHN